jgi:hypothetical protein
VQACHAVLEASRDGILVTDAHPHLVVLEAKDERKLKEVCMYLEANGVEHRCFIEPDQGSSLTSIATLPLSGDARRLFRRFQCLN